MHPLGERWVRGGWPRCRTWAARPCDITLVYSSTSNLDSTQREQVTDRMGHAHEEEYFTVSSIRTRTQEGGLEGENTQ